jgi:hypothetical protein
MPRALPMERNIHANSIQLRTPATHSLSRRPVTSAATAKEKGTEHPTNPV